MRQSSVRTCQRWNWSGDEIVFEPIALASRYLPDKTRRRYRIDLRQFVGAAGNAVVRGKLHDFVDALPIEQREAFRHNTPGSFDLRATLLHRLIRSLPYCSRKRGLDAWYFPEETLAQGKGDCEDRAFLLAALLLESGISAYQVRVAFGHVQNHLATAHPSFDHAWVMYKNEGGAWEILETVAAPQKKRADGARARAPRDRHLAPDFEADLEYVPHFVLNRDHLWRVRAGSSRANHPLVNYLEDRKFWKGFSPAFGAAVHESIIERALGSVISTDLLDRLNRVSLLADVNVLTYDPREHFDFSYVTQGWNLINKRLRS